MILPQLANFEAFFGADHVAYLMGFNMAVKVFLSGLFFYLYLKKMKISDTTSSIFALFYAFCAQMIIRGAWRSYPNEVLTFVMWLYAFESWFCNGKKWWGLILASAFLYFNSSGYYIVLYTGIFVVYALFRVLADWDLKKNEKKVAKIAVFAGGIICALLLSSMGWVSSITTQLKSDRLSNGTQKMGNYDFSAFLTTADSLKTAFYRTIGTDLLNINEFCGAGNFLEAPAFYCGILTLLLVPVLLVQAKGKRRIAYSIGITGVFLYIFVKPVRFLANGFASHTFKLSSLWVMVLMLYIAASGFDQLLEDRGKIRLRWIAAAGLVITVAAGLFRIDGMNYVKLAITIVFLLVYVGIFCFYKYRNCSAAQVKRVLLVLAVAEVVFTSYDCVNKRGTMDNNLYEDGTMDALAFIDERNGASANFYRIDKQFQAYALCDSLYQNYMGTTAYIGGSGDRKSTGNFYQAVAMPTFGGNNHNMTGFSTSTKINTLMNVGYILSQVDMNPNFGYEKIGEIEGISVYENQYALPLGYVYDQYIKLEDYEKLDIEERRTALLTLCVLGEACDVGGITEAESVSEEVALYPYEVQTEIELTENWLKVELPECTQENVNLIALDIDSEDACSSMMEYYNADGDAVTTYIGVAGGSDTYILEFNDAQIQQVQIFGTNQYNIKAVRLYQVPKEVYYQAYIDACGELQKNGMVVQEMDSNTIVGTIESSKDGMMTFSIPYDKNWHVYIDGVEQALQPVNIAMMGTTVTQGTHEVQLIYHKENHWGWFAAAGVVLFAVGLVMDFCWSKNQDNT
ncbi:MAG: YfhO family protein, partial [Lachnospiraceae bacterium]|nr:YfhO family protein [Lachnospiraceae bacterium]